MIKVTSKELNPDYQFSTGIDGLIKLTIIA
jgi:hypothetical protein